MCFLNRLQCNSLNDQLSLEGMNENCEYIESSQISDIHTRNTDLSVIQLNIRGLLNKQYQINNLLCNGNVSLPIDVLLLCETWLKPSTLDLVKLKSYKSYHMTRKDRIGGGTSILVHDKLRSRYRNDLIMETTYLEHCIVELKTDKKNILLISAYRPPNTNGKVFLGEYKRLLESLKKQKNHEIIIGLDHNLDLLKSHLNTTTNDFLEINLDRELLPCISKPTRITNKSASLIDNILISRGLQRDFDSFIITEDISDHFACLSVIKDQNKSIKGPRFIKTRKLDDSKINDIIKKLQEFDWMDILSPLDTNDGFELFHSSLLSTIDLVGPEIEVKIRRNQTAKDPWITKGILTSIRRQKKLYLEQLHDTKKTEKYKTYRNSLQKILRKAKTDYFNNKCKEYKNDSRKLWKLIHSIINKTNQINEGLTAVNINGIPRYDQSHITNEFCRHFSSIGESFANKIAPSERNINDYLAIIQQNDKSIFFAPTDTREISYLIKDLLPKNSSGHEKVSNKLLKCLLPALLEPLKIIFNKSLSEGIFPEIMKRADVVPLYKSKNYLDTNNYRPISLLITISKLLEKIIYKRTYTFLDSSNQIYKSQYGFRTAHSCENAVSELVSTIIKGRQDGMYTLAVFLDLSKAFDSLEHEVLLKKLHRYGIRGTAHNWYKSYLENRQMRVKCTVASSGKLEYSDYMDIKYGTPQGSCLGPLIFLIFTNDLYRHLVYSSAILFADDTTLHKTHRNLNYLRWCVEDDLNTMSDWFAANKLTLNLDKTVCILFQKNTNKIQIALKINNILITSQSETKFLGIWLDQYLTWHSHIQKLIMKLKRNKFLLNHGKHMMNQETRKLVYHSHIASHLQYGLILWGQ